ncbi:TRAP transporter large permease [Oceanibacterium hippocampi]|uniref:TRAP transporter large permease protein n=1 Tax=Oceanibacterium hippocampi TaxID=745714 RepID=A0A1Y5TXF6_9PROT|nr:TRAP transporter large permease [Oceanibacterium hippocampi]SLN75748.1 Sialic acid TRAP transporter permease protein SiaT [Oceanibacterium hippocampi]
MDPFLLGTCGFSVVILLLMLRVPIAFCLGSVAVVCTFLFYAWPVDGAFDMAGGWRSATTILTSNSFDFVHSFELTMVPLFILLSQVAFHARITTDIYHSARIWLSRVPGGLAIASILGCGGFSAITGSSVACAAAMGKICTPEMLRYGYGPRLATSSVAVGGTLGSLIPPSVPFILYGIFTETSISKLFLAGILPGLISIVGYIIVIMVWVKVNPKEAPLSNEVLKRGDRRRAAMRAWPAVLLFLIIIVGIYGGVFTTTEAAAVSAATALVMGIAMRRLSMAAILLSLRETAYQTAMIFLIAFGAKIFVSFISLTGVSPWLIALVQASSLSDWTVIAILCLVFLVLGMFLDPIGILLLTLPVTVPLVEHMGLDLIWFGVIVVKLLEIGLITPPVGLNAFVIKAVTSRDIKVHTIFAGISRFLVAEFVILVLLLVFPAISLILPNSMN